MRTILVLLTLVGVQTVNAAVDVYEFKTTEQAEHYQQLVEELRCLVCQNQNLADSNSGLAQDLRHEVATQISNGASEKQVVDFMVARYGDFVRYKPPVKSTTLLLWFGPFLMLLIAVWGGLIFVRRRSNSAQRVLSPSTQAQLSHLLQDNDRDNTK